MESLVLAYGGQRPVIAADAFIAPGATVIGNVRIANQASIWFGCVVRGDVCHIEIGARTNLQDSTIVHVSRNGTPTLIGSDVTVGHQCVLHACTLEDRAFVGMSSTVMDDTVVESDAMLAAGSLLTPGKRVLRGQLWAGRPARYVRDLRRDEHESCAQRAAEYVELAQEYLRSLRAS
jgi:gamma-carbonic anhydrase